MDLLLLYTISTRLFAVLRSDTFWVAIGAIITACTLAYKIVVQDWLTKRREVKNISDALYFELFLNIEMLFSGEVERKPQFAVIETIKKEYVAHIKDPQLFLKIQELYAELDYYMTFSSKVYLNHTIPGNGNFVTEAQLKTQNLFLKYFGEGQIVYEWLERPGWNLDHPGQEYFDFKRDQAIEIKNKMLDYWGLRLKDDVQKLFGLE